MKDNLILFINELKECINDIKDTKSLEILRVKYIGKKGLITNLLNEHKKLPIDEKIKMDIFFNDYKVLAYSIFNTKRDELAQIELRNKYEKEKIDLNLEKNIELGSLHPITQVGYEIIDILKNFGFDIEINSEIETVNRNFDALNTPIDHPSRSESDTFYITENLLLRTHTTPMQIRAFEKFKSGNTLMKATFGKVYRPDYDITHTPMFHQIEGLYVNKDANFSNLKGFMKKFIEKIFKTSKIRFRPHYFPFTEPSAEIDIGCEFCSQVGCKVCKYSGWIEILGCGMITPYILEKFNYNIDNIKGWAFGLGIERIVMLKYSINDIRILYENNIEFLNQFSSYLNI